MAFNHLLLTSSEQKKQKSASRVKKASKKADGDLVGKILEQGDVGKATKEVNLSTSLCKAASKDVSIFYAHFRIRSDKIY